MIEMRSGLFVWDFMSLGPMIFSKGAVSDADRGPCHMVPTCISGLQRKSSVRQFGAFIIFKEAQK